MELQHKSQSEKLSQYTQDVLNWAEANYGPVAVELAAESPEVFTELVKGYSKELIKFAEHYQENQTPLKKQVVKQVLVAKLDELIRKEVTIEQALIFHSVQTGRVFSREPNKSNTPQTL